MNKKLKCSACDGKGYQIIPDRYYLGERLRTDIIKQIKVGDLLKLEMPPFCTGDYELTVYEDNKGKYVKEGWLLGCRSLKVYRNGKMVKLHEKNI